MDSNLSHKLCNNLSNNLFKTMPEAQAWIERKIETYETAPLNGAGHHGLLVAGRDVQERREEHNDALLSVSARISRSVTNSLR